MRKLSSFTFITLDGYYKGRGGDISWHRHAKEESEFSNEGLQSDNILLFGRVTFEMMASFWPTPMGSEHDAATATGMNKAEKIVFSNTLTQTDPPVAGWNNSSVVGGDIAGIIKKMKQTPGKDMTVLGSGSIVTHLAAHDLINEIMIMIDPVAIGQGTPLFHGINRTLDLQLVATRTFNSGVVLLTYKPKEN